MCAKKQENVTHNQKKNQSIEMNPKMTQKTELAYKDVKIVIITMLKYLNKNIRIMRREIEDIKNNQVELLEVKNVI